MAPPRLALDLQERVLSAMSAVGKLHPDLPALDSSGPSNQSLSIIHLMEAEGGSHHTWRSRFKFVRQIRPHDAARAAKGDYTTGAPAARRYLLTAAQDGTQVHEGFWRNVLAFAAFLDATVLVGGFTYQKGLFEDHAVRTASFCEDVQPYLAHGRVDLGPVDFCAEMNILPTATRPLSGLDTYTGAKWGVFPHAKIQLVSVPTLIPGQPKLIMTTGACTVPNYVAKKAGLKAEFHHVIGATLVEVDPAGRPFCRQINATDDGSFQDLDVIVEGGKCSAGHRVEAITWGDIHREKIDPTVARACWGLDVETDRIIADDSMIDVLRPRHQIMHDLLDFEARNHHRRNDHFHHFAMWTRGRGSVQGGLMACASFLHLTDREWCQTVVVPSNHHDALHRWLMEAEWRSDAENALVYLRLNTAIYEAIQAGDRQFDVFKFALNRARPGGLPTIAFVPPSGSYVICQQAGGIECAIHGHEGPNGSRGSPLALTKVATKMNTGHTHSASIYDGVYTAGLCGLFDQDYNSGASSWSQTQVVTYPNGRRTLITMHGPHWRA